MITAALDASVNVGFVTGDECYGRDPQLRATLQARGIGYVLAVARNHYTQVTTATRERVDVTEAWLLRRSWQRRSAGHGSKGERFYDWAWVSLHDDTGGHHSLLIRRNRASELAFYRCWTPHPVPLAVLVATAGTRWGGRGELSDRQRPGRPRPLPVPRLDTLAPLHHPGHARTGYPHHHRRRHEQALTSSNLLSPTHRPDRPDRALGTPTDQHDHDPAGHPDRSPRLFSMATTTPSPSESQPLQTTRTHRVRAAQQLNCHCRTRPTPLAVIH